MAQTYPWLDATVQLPTDYPHKEEEKPYVGYQPPEGSEWYQNFHREISTPFGGPQKSKWGFDYNGKRYDVPIDEHLKVDVSFPMLGDQLRYGINYNQYTDANTRAYWSNPQRVARVKTLIDNVPEGEEIPDWIDKDKITTLYNYLEFKNPNKPIEQWNGLTEDDPAYEMLYQIDTPPQEMLSPFERDPVYMANKFLQDYQKRWNPEATQGAIKSLMESRGITFEEAQSEVETERKIDLSKLEPAQKFLLSINSLVPPDSNAEDWMMETSAISAGVKGGLGAAGLASGLVAGTSIISSMATTGAITGSGLGPAGTIIVGTVGAGVGLSTYLAMKRGDEATAMKLMKPWMKGQEFVEQLIGTVSAYDQVRNLGMDPNAYSFKDYWNAGKGAYETGLYGIGNAEANFVQAVAHNINKEWSSGLQAGTGEVWQLQKGIVEPQAIREGFLVGQPLAESVIRLSNGEDVDSVYWDMVDRYGYSGTRADYIAQNWLDPLQYLPYLTNIGATKIAGKLEMPGLAYSFQQARGKLWADALPGNIAMPLGFAINQVNRFSAYRGLDWGPFRLPTTTGIADVINYYKMDTGWQYYSAGKPMTAYGLENMSPFAKRLAGIDPVTNLPTDAIILDTDGKVLASRSAKLFGSSPEGAIGHDLIKLNSAFRYLGALSSSPEEFMTNIQRVIDGAEYVKNHPNDPTAQVYDSPNMRAIRSSLKAAIDSDAIKTQMTIWKASEGRRIAIGNIAEALSKKPIDIIQMMKDNKYTDLVDQLTYSTKVKNPIVEAIQTGKITAESLKKSMKVYITNDMPYYPEMMTVRLENRITDLTAERLGKAYGLDLNQKAGLWKWLGLNKSVQSLALLNTPTFVMKNLLNNMVTMGYDGIGSLFTAKHNEAILTRYGAQAPTKLLEGYSSIGKLASTPENAKLLVDVLQKNVNKFSNKAGIFTKMAGNIEGKAKMTAYANGYQQGFEAWYQDAVPTLPNNLRTALRDAGHDPNQVETLIRAMTRMDQFDQGIDTTLGSKVVMAEALNNAIGKLYDQPTTANDLITKLSILDNALRYVETEGLSPDQALSRVYRDIETDAYAKLANEVADSYEQASQDMNVSGWGGVTKIADDLEFNQRFSNLDNDQRLHDITIEASRIRKDNPGEIGKRTAYDYYNVMTDDLNDQIFIENRADLEKTMAVIHRLNPANEVEAGMEKLLLERIHLVQESKTYVIEENNKYWDPDSDSKLSYEEVQAKVRKGQQLYADKINDIDTRIDEQFLKIFNFDKDTLKTAELWVENRIKMRAEVAELTKSAFKKLANESEAGRRRIWQETINKKAQIIAKYSGHGIDLNEQINISLKKVKHNGPTPVDNAVPPEPDWGETPSTSKPNEPGEMFQPAEQMPDIDTLKQTTYSGEPNYQGRNKQKDLYTLEEGRLGQGLEYDEFAYPNRAASELEMIDNKYRGRWIRDNAEELKTLRKRITDQYGLTEETGQMVIAMMARKAEDNTFRLGGMDPMNYMRRYRFEETTSAEMVGRAKALGLRSAGTASIDWDVENAKWVIKAVKGKAGISSLLHELLHTFIFDLDRGDMIALNEIFGYGTVEELYNNHRGWLTKRKNDGELFDRKGFQDYAKRSEEVVKIAEEYFFQKYKFGPDQYAKGITGLIQKFRDYVVDVMDKYRSGWLPEQKIAHNMWVKNTKISPTIEQALNRMIVGYRKDKVWSAEGKLKRTPVMGSVLGDIFGLEPDAKINGYSMYRIADYETKAVTQALDARLNYKLDKVDQLKHPGTTDSELLLPPDLEFYMPTAYASEANTYRYGDPGEPKAYPLYKYELELANEKLFNIDPYIRTQAETTKIKFTAEEAGKLITRDINEEAYKLLTETGVSKKDINSMLRRNPLDNSKWYVSSDILESFNRKLYSELYGNQPTVKGIVGDDLRDKIVYWNSFRDSGLYGYSPEELARLERNYVYQNGTISDPDVIYQRQIEFNKIKELSELITTASDLYDKILKNPTPSKIDLETIDYTEASTRYALVNEQVEAIKQLKEAFINHNRDISVDGLSVYPQWKLPIYMEEALGIIKPKTEAVEYKNAPRTNTEDPFYVARDPFREGHVPSHSDYIGAKFSDWPAEDADLVKQTVRSWFVEDTENNTYTFTERFKDHPKLKDVPEAEIDMALRKIMEGKYTVKDKTQRLIISELLNRFYTDKADNSINLRSSLFGVYNTLLDKINKDYIEPLAQAHKFNFDPRIAPTWYAKKAMQADTIQETIKLLKTYNEEIDTKLSEVPSYNKKTHLSPDQLQSLKQRLREITDKYNTYVIDLNEVVSHGVAIHSVEDFGISKDISDDLFSADNTINQANIKQDLDKQSGILSQSEKDLGIDEPLSEIDVDGSYKAQTAYDIKPKESLQTFNKLYKEKNYVLAEQVWSRIIGGDVDIVDFLMDVGDRKLLRSITNEIEPGLSRKEVAAKTRLYQEILAYRPYLNDPDPEGLLIEAYKVKAFEKEADDIRLAIDDDKLNKTGSTMDDMLDAQEQATLQKIDTEKRWEDFLLEAKKDLNKIDEWDPMVLAKTDPKVQSDIDLEKRFIDATAKEMLGRSGVKAQDSYKDIQTQMIYKIAESYVLWDKDHGVGSANFQNDEFTTWLQRRVFPTLTNENKSGSVYDVTQQWRTDFLFTPREDLESANLLRIAEYHLSTDTKFDPNDWDTTLPLFQGAEDTPSQSSLYPRYLEAITNGEVKVVKEVSYTASRMARSLIFDGIKESPIRIITASDLLLKLFPDINTMDLDYDARINLYNFVNAIYLKEAGEYYTGTNPYKYLLPGTEVGTIYNDRLYRIPAVISKTIDSTVKNITNLRKTIEQNKEKLNNPVLSPLIKNKLTSENKSLLKQLKPLLKKYNDVLKEYAPESNPNIEYQSYRTPYEQEHNMNLIKSKGNPNQFALARTDYIPMGPPNSLTVSAPGMYPGKVMADMLPDIKNLIDETRSNLRNVRTGTFDDFSAGLNPEHKANFNNYINKAKSAMATAQQYANDFALSKANFALLNYNDRTGADDWMDAVFPYQFWFTRSMVNWAKRVMNRPSIISQFANRMEHMERMGKDLKNYPLRLQGRMQIPWPFAEDWMGENIYINPWNELMPVNQILAPLEYLSESLTIDPTDRLRMMLNEKQITQEEYDKAIEEKKGDLWDSAYKLAQMDMKDRTRPIDLASMLMSPNWLLTEADAWLNDRTQRNQPMTNLGFTLQSHGDRIKGNGYEIVGDALIKVGEGLQLPEKKLRGERFIYYDKHGTELIMRELSNMAAEGTPTNDCLTAMIEQKGELWDEASGRVRDQFSLKTPGSLLAQAMEEGDLTSIPLGLLLTMFPAGIFPEGELKQKGLYNDFQEVIRKADAGDPTAMADWFDEHPEYLVRSAINDSPKLKLKKYFINQIMDYYTSEDPKNKTLFKEHLGDAFIDKILNGEDKDTDYNALSLEELAGWARMAKAEIPDTPDTSGYLSPLPESQMPKLLNDDQLLEINTYFDERNRLFPNHEWQNRAYHNQATSKEKSIFLAKYPELKYYWEWNKAYKNDSPALKEWLERNTDPVTQQSFDPYYGVDPEIIDGYRAQKAQAFPNSQWLNQEYWSIPEENSGARRAFLKKYPELPAYWDWKKEVEAQFPQIKYYNSQVDIKYQAEEAFPVNPADMPPNKIAEALDALDFNEYVTQDLLNYYVFGMPIPYGSMSYLKQVWENAGKPDTLMKYIDNLF